MWGRKKQFPKIKPPATTHNEITEFFRDHYEKFPTHVRSQSRLYCVTCGDSPLPPLPAIKPNMGTLERDLTEAEAILRYVLNLRMYGENEKENWKTADQMIENFLRRY